MDKFVTRAPTWQTLTYTTALDRSRKNILLKNVIVKKKPLQESQLKQSSVEVMSPQRNKRRLSIRDEQLLKIFASRPDQPLVPPNEDSGLSSSSQGSVENFNDVAHGATDENQTWPVKTSNLCELRDYVGSADTTRSQQNLFISQTPPVTLDEVVFDVTQNNPVAITSGTAINPNTERNIKYQANCNNNEGSLAEETAATATSNQHPQMARIQRDLNSPSANARVRAIRALKNPTKSTYTNFDVPYEEQNIISVAERQPPPPLSIEELMRDIVVYVEVRTGEDNRSEGVKKVISQLGARVNDKLLRGTTHVIFKDGLLSTYKKAKNWNIPVVSILWVEACKNKRTICDPNEFPISNIDRYENPELYEKMKRHKSMQPDSECNKRVRLKQGTPKDNTPKTVAESLTKTSSDFNTPKSSRKQTDISQYFRKLASFNSTPIADNNVLPASTTSITKVQDVAESPATQLLNRIESNSFTPLQPRQFQFDTKSTTLSMAMSLKTSKSGNLSEHTIISTESKKCVHSPSPSPSQRIARKTNPNLASPKKRVLRRRSSIQMPIARSKSDYSLQVTETVTPGRVTRRRSSIHTTVNMSLSTLVPNTPDLVSNANQTTFSAIPEENGGNTSKASANKAAARARNMKSPKEDFVTRSRITRRRTLYTNKTPEMSPKKKEKTTRRRTLYTPKPIEECSLAQINETPQVLDENLLKFALTPTTLIDKSKESLQENEKKKENGVGALIEEHSAAVVFSSTRLPSANRRRTLFDVSMDIIQQRLHNINNSARRVMAQELACVEKSPSIFPPTINTNATTSTTKAAIEFDDEIDKKVVAATDTTPASTHTISPRKTVKKRKLFVPNDTSLILTATPPTSAKKSTTESNSKRRRTMTPNVIEKRSIQKPRSSIAVNGGSSHSDMIIKPSSPLPITNVTKSEVQLVPTLTNDLAKNEKEPILKGSCPQLERNASTINCKGNEQLPSVTEKCDVVPEVAQKSLLIKDAEVATSTTQTNATTISTILPKSNGSFMSLISSKTSDTVVNKQLQHDIEVDENIAVNTPSDSVILSQPTAAPSTTLVDNANLLTTTQSQSQPKVVTKSQMSAMPCEAKSAAAVVVAAAASVASTQLTKSASGGNKKLPYIVCTNMHREQVKVIREAIATLGGLQLNHCVNDDTTHVISYEPRRTLNLLRGLIRGLWILDYKWVIDSLKAGSWLNEEEYELRVFSRAVEICRTERQAFGNTYKCELFTDLGAFYISSRCGPISKDNLKELIVLCGGKMVDHRKRAKYIIGGAHGALEGKVYVNPFWVLDSITHMQVMRQQKYAYASNPIAKPPTPLPQTNAEAVVST
ncbi:uncharacterized protein LOC128868574 [Anastrepha ludens]|uniref:uncharacterized protein LOC128868574 n=1 Tax=Anastrepha ludens TaxID=28586 RepID=UPI0023AF41A4|nr:uncharacterized protein LOC128868574 [Anastrepha ludens]